MAKALIDRLPPDDVAAVVLPVTSAMRVAPTRLDESRGLVEALGVRLAFLERVNIREPHPARLFGSGQLDAIAERLSFTSATMLVVDGALTPVQQRNLETELQVKVIDRTGLILEIFGLRARTAEGRLQVEMARSLYERSRLVRTWTHLERQRGGFGFLGGPGETQLEADRRLLDRRIAGFRRDLEDVRRTRGLQRSGRARRGMPVAALVGYTNAGKSTLFNKLTGAQVFMADMPFATLDPTARDISLPGGRRLSMIDTVGFITDLPTHLVAAFRATLEEAMEADVLIHVRDIAHANTEGQAEDVRDILERLAEQTGVDAPPPVIEAWNKSDLLDPEIVEMLRRRAGATSPPSYLISGASGAGVDDLLNGLERQLFGVAALREFRLEPAAGKALAWLHAHCNVVSQEQDEDGCSVLKVWASDLEVGRITAMGGATIVSNNDT